ncbi:MAG: hypothetical protein COS34_01720 [Lysobacterales bacterium CG02_land_8_20_14_3_00_62_12]|nr:MAG: hypothetical protein COS34_01720 [Xanthomonadales bacterium CG02_land_8_20_14_3_00_62_12]
MICSERRPPDRQSTSLRQQLAAAAARMMSEQGVRDFAMAKRKAAAQLGVAESSALPSNREIDRALRQYQGLFQSIAQPRRLRELRLAAVSAMQFFERFGPCLAGAVLDGSADQHSAVCLHLFVADATAVERFLLDQNIPFASDHRRLHADPMHDFEVPVIRFAADEVAFDLSIFDTDQRRQAPLDRITGKPTRRATLAQVQALLDQP